MINPFYKVKLVSAVGIRWMNPDGINKIVHKLDKYDGGRHGYKEEFEVDIIFRGGDFQYMKDLSDSTSKYDDVRAVIYIRCNGQYVPKYRALISPTSAKYGLDICTLTASFNPATLYSNYDDVKGTERNAFSLTNVRRTVELGTQFVTPDRITVQNGVPLYNILSELLRIDLSASLKSDFFQWNSSNPTYVVGNSAKFHYLTLYQQSDIVRATHTSYAAATIMNINLGDLVDDLCALFNLEYYIDSGNNFVIEHVSWFSSGPTYDLVTNRYKPYTIGTNRFGFDKSTIYKKERFSMPDSLDQKTKTTGLIEYDNSFVRNSPDTVSESVDITVKILRTNVYQLYGLEADDISNSDGIVLIAVRDNGVIENYGPNENDILLWPKLLPDYYRYDRIFDSGYVNGSFTTFFSTKRIKLQNSFKIPICCDETFDPFTHFTTILGEGIVKSMNIDHAAGTAELSLLYEFDGSNDLEAPIAADDFYATAIDTTVDTFVDGKPSLLANDTDVISVDPETKATSLGGTVAIAANGHFVYTPPLGLHGGDSFEYTGIAANTRADVGNVRVIVKSDNVYLHVEVEHGSSPLYPTGSLVYHDNIVAKFYEDPLLLVPLDVTGYGITLNYSRTLNGVTTSQVRFPVGFEASLFNYFGATNNTVTVTVTPNPDFTII